MRAVNIGSTAKPKPKYSVKYQKRELQLCIIPFENQAVQWQIELAILLTAILAEGFALFADK